ncbi:hypothetical protein DENIS_5194 [Desulfonema ishimotonii]|uniref:Uncharacterized protein n=1 Tax=Desulfonema ishimotonii TaxID=45657 RepID=A0A401G4M5_9BACT|nr:hypothetical protein [Desulfonema ishimotonii]GBC64176.1 hypothetical protein DENIS_5194 [Desulfonema ishimotonii]
MDNTHSSLNINPFTDIASLLNELTDTEIEKINMRFWGDVILKKVQCLSQKISIELLTPISAWIDDEDWVVRFDYDNVKITPDWANYKRTSRQWSKQQMSLSGERLKFYLQAIKTKKEFREKVSQLVGSTRSKTDVSFEAGNNFLFPIVQPFSKSERNRNELEKEFIRFAGSSVLSLLPWRAMILSSINETKKFSEIESYLPENPKADNVCKFMNLLQLSSEGIVSLSQEKPFEDVEIKMESGASTNVVLKDRSGNEWREDWQELRRGEKAQRLDQIKSHQVICRQVEN